MTDLFPSRKTKTLQLWSPSLSLAWLLRLRKLAAWGLDFLARRSRHEGSRNWRRMGAAKWLRGTCAWSKSTTWAPLQMLSPFIDMIFSNICFQWLPSAWATHMPAYTMQLISTCALYQYLHRLLAHHRETARIKQGHMTSPAMVWKPKFAVIQHISHWHTEQVVAPSDSAYPHSSYSFATPPNICW